MKQNIKPITKQLLIATFLLTLVTALSFGIRHVRFSIHRADNGEFTPSARHSDTEDQPQHKQFLNTDAEPDYYPADSLTVDAEPDPQYANVSDWDEQAPSEDNSKAHTDSIKYDKAVSKAKSFKGGYVKSGGSKGLEKISLDGNENIYITEKGEVWYVSKEPDGSTAKVQLEEDIDGDIDIVDDGKDY